MKTALSSHVTCLDVLSSRSVPFFSFNCFPWLLFTLNSCWKPFAAPDVSVRRGRDTSAVGKLCLKPIDFI